MRSILTVFFLALFIGCKGKSAESSASQVDNPAIRYVDSLKDDKSRAQSAADKYNEAAHQQEQAAQEAANQ
jgi:hypothetical protein